MSDFIMGFLIAVILWYCIPRYYRWFWLWED